MKTLVRAIALLFAVAATVRGEVLVYQGSARAALNSIDSFGKAPRAYVVVDVPSQLGYLILYYNAGGTKDSVAIPFEHTRYNPSANYLNEKEYGTFTSVSYLDFGASGFTTLSLYLRGRETTLTLASFGGSTMGVYPKTLTGALRQAQLVNQLGTNFELNFTLTFDALRTQTSNNGTLNGLVTVQGIRNELATKGF